MKPLLLFSFSLAFALSSCKPEAPAEAKDSGEAAAPAGEQTASPATDGHRLFIEDFERSPGVVIEATEVMKMTDGSFGIESPQGGFEGKMDMATTKELRFETESGDKVKATISKNEVTQKMVMNGQEMPQPPQTKPLVGVPLVISRTDGEWAGIREDGAEVAQMAEAELKSVTRKVSRIEDRNLYGTETRKPGESWEVDAAESMMLEDSDEVEGTVKLTFDKLGDYEGKECAFISGTFEMKGSAPEEAGGGEGSMSLKGTFTIIRSIEHQLDLYRQLDGAMEVEMTTPMGKMRMAGPTTITETASIEK